MLLSFVAECEDLTLSEVVRLRRLLSKAHDCQNTGWVAGLCSGPHLTHGVGSSTAPLQLRRRRVVFKS